MALSDTNIKQLKLCEKDFKESGFYLLVKTTGSKLWRLKYRFGGKEKTYSIVSYPEISLKEARELRDAARSQVAEGVAPNETKCAAKAVQQGLNSFEVIVREWCARELPAWAPATAKKRLALLENDLFPWVYT